MKTHTSIIVASALSAGLSLGLFQLFDKDETKVIVNEVEQKDSPSSTIKQVGYTPRDFSSFGQMNFTAAAENSLNGVVHIKTKMTGIAQADPLYQLFYGQRNRTYQQEASGSGVIISQDGYIATNNHVIEDADEISVTLNNSETYTAKLIGRDPSTDLALLKIEADNLSYVEFANSDEVKVGEWVLAVGNPFNLTSTVTAGIVSAKARSINILKGDSEKDIFPIESFIQTDAAVNPGNSGGALVNTNGQLIGINTAIASKTGSYSGYSFAVPSNMVQKVTSDLLKFGVVQRGFIGVGLAEINQEMLTELDLPNLKGVLVTGVLAESAGADAGLKQGDVILKVGETEVNKVPSLQENIGKFSPGDKITLTIRRGNTEKVVPVILKNKDGNTGVVAKEITSTSSAMGVEFEDISQKTKTSLQINRGVRISSVGSGKFKSAGVPEGFIITKIDQKSVTNAKDVSEYISKKKGGILLEGIYPNGMKGYFGFGL